MNARLYRLNPTIEAITPSATVAITVRAAEMRRQGIDVISMGAGEPDFDTPPHIAEAAIAAIHNGQTRYTAPDGTPELKAAIVQKLANENGLAYDMSEIAVSSGGKHTLHNLFSVLLDPGDEVLLFSPYWVSYPQQIRLAGGHPVVVETSASQGFVPTPDQIRSAITNRTRLMVVNSPCNPTGSVWSRATLAALMDIAIEHGLLVISDEVYEAVLYGEQEHVSPASLSEDAHAHTITMNSVSKTYAMTGWRVGYAAGPSSVMKAIGRLQSHQSQNPASPSQAAAIAALEGGLDCTRPMVKAFSERRRLVIQAFDAIAGVDLLAPAGTFYAFPEAAALLASLPADGNIRSSSDLCRYLLDSRRVACVPGEPFGAPTCFRLSFATSTESVVSALDRIQDGIAALTR